MPDSASLVWLVDSSPVRGCHLLHVLRQQEYGLQTLSPKPFTLSVAAAESAPNRLPNCISPELHFNRSQHRIPFVLPEFQGLILTCTNAATLLRLLAVKPSPQAAPSTLEAEQTRWFPHLTHSHPRARESHCGGPQRVSFSISPSSWQVRS